MSLAGPDEAVALSTEMDKHVLESFREQLKHNVRRDKIAREEFKAIIHSLIDTYKTTCFELQAAQSDLLNQAYQNGNSTCDILGPPKQYETSDPHVFVATIGDMSVSYMPKSQLVDDPPPKERDSGTLDDSTPNQHLEQDDGVGVELNTPDISFTRDASEIETETETESNPPEAPPRKKRIRTYSKRTPELLSNSDTVVPYLASPRVYHFDTTGCKDINVRLLTPDIELKWSKPLQLTSQPHIKREVVKKEKRAWVFSYTLDKRTALYIIRCPANCPSPVFSRHPLRRSRAIEHLRDCQVPFNDEEDMVRKYAQQVVMDRKDRWVRLDWARKHNYDLFGELEEDVDQENFR